MQYISYICTMIVLMSECVIMHIVELKHTYLKPAHDNYNRQHMRSITSITVCCST
jgi:ABC-type dipeptide/oligopeptide/nickel transport system ATPase subunit